MNSRESPTHIVPSSSNALLLHGLKTFLDFLQLSNHLLKLLAFLRFLVTKQVQNVAVDCPIVIAVLDQAFLKRIGVGECQNER